MAVVPHLTYPFRMTSRGADVLEQDSIDEITQCVQMLVFTNLGTRIELPEYGIPDQTFVADPQVNTAVIRAQCSTWEPRAEVALASTPDQFDELVRHLRITVEAQTATDSPIVTAPPAVADPGDVEGLTWDEATMTWDEATFTWDET